MAESVSRLQKIMLDGEDSNHFVLIDKTAIKAIQVQLPTLSSSLHLQGENSLGVVRVFVENMTAPFQFTRNTAEELEDLVEQLL